MAEKNEEKNEEQIEETPAAPESVEETPVEAEAPVEEPEAAAGGARRRGAEAAEEPGCGGALPPRSPRLRTNPGRGACG
jgi:hypothetical protein